MDSSLETWFGVGVPTLGPAGLQDLVLGFRVHLKRKEGSGKTSRD